MYYETEGIVIKKNKINNTDVFLTLFSKNLGKIQVFVKNAGNPKSTLNKASHPFVYGTFSLRGEKTYSLAGIEMISSFYNFRENLKRLSYGSYLLDVVDHTISEDENNKALYRLLIDSLMFLSKTEGYEENIKLYFEINALKALGYMPEVKECISCGVTEEFKKISIQDGGVVCEKCSAKMPQAISIHPMMVQLIAFVSENTIGDYLKKEINSLLIDKMDIFINSYLEYYLGLKYLKSKKFLKIYE